jgi:hypothetical protein
MPAFTRRLAARTQIGNQRDKIDRLGSKRVLYLPKGLRKRILSYLHPDLRVSDNPAALKWMEKTFQEWAEICRERMTHLLVRML